MGQWEQNEKMNQFIEAIENDLDNIAKSDQNSSILAVSFHELTSRECMQELGPDLLVDSLKWTQPR